MREVEYQGNRITLNDDGTITVVRPDGSKISTTPGGGAQMSIDQIRKIGIANVIDIKNYILTEHEGLILHAIEFHAGGILSIAYSTAGRLENLTSRNLRVEVTSDNDVIYHRE